MSSPKAHDETHIELDWAETKVSNAKNPDHRWGDKTQKVRIYGYSPGRLALQIRTYGKTGDWGKKMFAAYSHASLNLVQAMQIRDALDEWIAREQAKP